MARATLTLYRAYVATRDATQVLAARLSDGGERELDLSGIPSEEVSGFIQRHKNHFPAMRRQLPERVMIQENRRSSSGRCCATRSAMCPPRE